LGGWVFVKRSAAAAGPRQGRFHPRDDPVVADLGEIAASALPLRERARCILERLDRWLAVDATWLTVSDPDSTRYATVGSTGLDRSVLDYLDRPTVAREIQMAGLNQSQPPVSLKELPIAADDLPTWAECLIPAGFRDGLGVPLTETGGRYVGMLTVLYSGGESPSHSLRDRIGKLAPLIARGVSPMPSLLATARLVQDATSGAVLFRGGTLRPLPGLEDHALLAAESPVVKIAQSTLLAGQVYRSFMWPAQDGNGTAGHARMTVLAATDDVPAFVLGTVLMTPHADCRGLTPRELQVLGLVVEGRSNQQIASQLTVATRTVAAHVEHILHKLDAPTRTQAAVLAEREGCHVPSALH
jgi:DNA-binding CsgD family transcriptional regulator